MSKPRKAQSDSQGFLRRHLLVDKPPFWMISAAVILFCLSLVPLAVIAVIRTSHKSSPRIHFIQDMDNQPRYSTQQPSVVFADGRASRPPVPGTVAQGMLAADDHLDRGYKIVAGVQGATAVAYFDGFPSQVQVDEKFLKRGQKVYNIYCAPCHGLDGYGNGAVNQRALDLQEPKWVPASNLHTAEIRARSEGHLYNTVHNGIRNMPGYGSQIETKDRWAVVAYVRALQRSQNASVNDVPANRRSDLK